MKRILIAVLSVGLLYSCSMKQEKTAVSKYPVTKKTYVVDTLFGTAVADPYRWLENDTAKETADWVKAENEVTFGYLEKIPFRDAIRK